MNDNAILAIGLVGLLCVGAILLTNERQPAVVQQPSYVVPPPVVIQHNAELQPYPPRYYFYPGLQIEIYRSPHYHHHR